MMQLTEFDRRAERRQCIGGVGCGSFAARGLSSASEWNSESLPNLVADFDSRYNVSVSGTDVTNWTAARGLAYQFGAGGTLPQYSATGWVGTRRTVPSITLTGLNDQLTSTNTVGGIALANRLFGGTDQPGTVLLVYQILTLGVVSGLVAFSKAGLTFTDQVVNFSMIDDGTGHLWRCRKRDDSLTNKVCESATLTHDTNKHVMAWTSSGTNVVQYQDGGANLLTSSDWDVGAVTVDTVEIGAIYTGSPCDMRLVRAIFYSDNKTEPALDSAYAGLAQLYL